MISEAHDWFYVREAPREDGTPCVARVVAWQELSQMTLEENYCPVVGLIAVSFTIDQSLPEHPHLCRLVTPPPLAGTYKHLSQLSNDECIAAQKGM